MIKITFEKATFAHKDIIFHWLDEPHVIEFWDNSPEHRLDIINFMEGRLTRSPYLWNQQSQVNGIFDYWIGSIDHEPYAMLMTSEITNDDCVQENLPYGPYLSATGKSFGIDFMIGNTMHLGKGLAAPTLEAFTTFFQKEVEPTADTFIIDPNDDNPRAQHVYAKAGFDVMGEAATSEMSYFKGKRTHIMVKKMKHEIFITRDIK